MFTIAKFNQITFDVDTTDFEFCKLKDLYDPKHPDTVFQCNGLFIHKSDLGDSPVLICGDLGKLVNIPAHKVKTFQSILWDDDAVKAIREGKVGFKIYTYKARGKICYSINFVDL